MILSFCSAGEDFGEAGFFAGGGVFRNDPALGGLVDRLVCGRKRGGGFRGFSGDKKIADALGRGQKRALATQIEDALLERRAVGLLGGRGNCHKILDLGL